MPTFFCFFLQNYDRLASFGGKATNLASFVTRIEIFRKNNLARTNIFHFFNFVTIIPCSILQILLSNFFYRAQIERATDGEDKFIPWAFIDLLRVVLARMVGSGWLHPSLGGIQFWRGIPSKYQTIRNYQRSKVIKNSELSVVFFCFYISLL